MKRIRAVRNMAARLLRGVADWVAPPELSKRDLVYSLLYTAGIRRESGARRLAWAAKYPFEVDPNSCAQELVNLVPAEAMFDVLHHLYANVHEKFSKEEFDSYFQTVILNKKLEAQ